MRKIAFWSTVALVSVGANFLAELAAERARSIGLKQFVAFTHRGMG